eukprot:Phypoly_transcript_22256.p1 GENE.Phypoly_transcript_22256~~Phypoly_transcript_22256.p1  ORF type:complete len:188 (+),score=29.24 Phypoly_transcript_22256:71-565(+)
MKNTGCPSACGGAPYSSGQWALSESFSHGSYNFTAQGPSQSGTAVTLAASGTGADGKWAAVRMFLIATLPNQISFDTFVGGAQNSLPSYTLPFTHNSGLHTYSFTFTSTAVTFYADGKLIASTTHTPNSLLAPSVSYEAHPSWWGPLVYTGPTSVALVNVQYHC